MVNIKSIILTLLFVLTVFNSCNIVDEKDENMTKVGYYVIDIISHERLDNTEIQILEWHESIFSEALYSITKETSYTDANGYFLINYHSNPKYDYSLGISRDLYFKEDMFLPFPSFIEYIGIFPQGFVKTHITNKIDTTQYIILEFTPIYSSQLGYNHSIHAEKSPVQVYLHLDAFTDTSFVTTTISGVTNNLKVSYGNYVAKDTSFLTLRHDTVNLNIILY